MVITGGLRARLVFDSVYNEINDALTSLGWYDSGRQHSTFTFVTEPVDETVGVPPNTLVLVGEDIFTSSLEVGSEYAEHRRTFYLDFYAENQSIGEHVIFDCKDILQGRMASHGRTGPIIPIKDYSSLGDPEIAMADVESVEVDRGHAFQYPWQKFWYSCSFVIVDEYGNETL